MIVIKFYDSFKENDNSWYYCRVNEYAQLNHFIHKAYLFETPEVAKEVADKELLKRARVVYGEQSDRANKYLLKYIDDVEYKLLEVDDNFETLKEVTSPCEITQAEIEIDKLISDYEKRSEEEDRYLRCLGHDGYDYRSMQRHNRLNTKQ